MSGAHRHPDLPCSVTDCERPSFTRRDVLCQMHYTRMRRHGNLDGVRPWSTAEQRFARFTPRRPDGECWEWAGTRSTPAPGWEGSTYGVLHIPGSGKVYAHRYSYERAVGPVGGAVVRHTCDNPPCVNPAHLVLGDHLDNARDRVERERTPSRLAARDVVEIRRRAAAGETSESIARDFPCSASAVRNIKRRQTWRHLPDVALGDAG